VGLALHAHRASAQQSSPPVATELPPVVVESTVRQKPKRQTSSHAPVRAAARSRTGNRPQRSAVQQASSASSGGGSVASASPGKPVAALQQPAGETTYSQSRDSYRDTPALTVGDMLSQTPGVTFITGNGPRDLSVSIRGSNDHMAFGIRNIEVLEDGFPLVQPDGRARADIIDPHAYGSIDTFQGPASTLYGDYATGGALNLNTRRGADIQGVEIGSDFGSFGMLNNYVTFGTAGKNYDLMLFDSNVQGHTAVAHNDYDTQTVNGVLRYEVTPDDRLIFKVISNETFTQQSVRLSLNQFNTNPFQNGCSTLQSAGCGSVNLFANGAFGPQVAVSPQGAGLMRDDRRTLGGVRWEHDIDNDTLWRTQFSYDSLSIDQPNTAVSEAGNFGSFDIRSDITHRGSVFDMPLTSFAGVDFANLQMGDHFHNLTPSGGASLGPLSQTIFGSQTNASARFQEDLQFASKWRFVTGLGLEYSQIRATETNFDLTQPGQVPGTIIPADRTFFNLAPEASLIYTPANDLTLHARVGTGYGTPQPFSLFTTPQGTFGNNTALKAQSNVGYDLGAEWKPVRSLSLNVTGFYEFFKNEQITQSAGAGLQTYTFNAPASQHRGFELSALWQPAPEQLPGARVQLSYLYDNQIYTIFVDTISNATAAASFNRDGYTIPGVVPQSLNLRFLYDQDTGPLKGVGGFIELVHRSSFELDNANLISAPGYDLVNAGLHYDIPGQPPSFVRKIHLYFEVQNLFNKTYVGSASNITDTLAANGQVSSASALAAQTGSIFAGNPRTFYGGIRLLF
jgi:iron complex outermembrane recepter protein